MDLVFTSLDRLQWVNCISSFSEECRINTPETVVLCFNGLDEKKIEPMHIASLACLIEQLARLKIHIKVNRDSALGEDLWTKYQLREYWGGQHNFVSTKEKNILNLWRVVESEKDLHALRVSEYLKQAYFQHKDLSSVSSNLTEVYYNAFDHAAADGNIFSMVSFSPDENRIKVAVCDFGRGIAKSVQTILPLLSDEQALAKAIESKFTIKSTQHNAGMGLDNIRMSCVEGDKLYIISNRALLVADSESFRTKPLDYSFNGTLIFYNLTVSHFEDEETISEFSF